MITLVPNKSYTPAAATSNFNASPTSGNFNKPQSQAASRYFNNSDQDQPMPYKSLDNNPSSLNQLSNGKEIISPKNSMSISPPPVNNISSKSESPRDSVVNMSQATLKQRVNMVVMRMIAQNSDQDQRSHIV